MSFKTADPVRVLLIGGGGREHAIAWSLSKCPQVETILCAPGNGGTAHGSGKIANCNATVKSSDFKGLLGVARTHCINLVVPCSDASLILGAVDFFEAHGFRVFGPSKDSAKIEGSKSWSKDFMKRYEIPTAKYQAFSSASEAISFLQSQPERRHVVKASGLAAGKGVFLCADKQEAEVAVNKIMVERAFGDAGEEIVIEEFLVGRELSVTVITDGNTWRLFPFGQDAQRVFDGNHGANTGGIGVCIPLDLFTKEEIQDIRQQILEPTIRGLQSEGYKFVGFICTGIMQTDNGPKLLEYNARFGDPEAQALFPLLDHTSNLADIMISCIEGRLDRVHLEFQHKAAISLVIASCGYPGDYEVGKTIRIGELPEGVLLFHSGTLWLDDSLVSSGGRVLVVVCMADSTEDAIRGAYGGASKVNFEGKYLRTDIGKIQSSSEERVVSASDDYR